MSAERIQQLGDEIKRLEAIDTSEMTPMERAKHIDHIANLGRLAQVMKHSLEREQRRQWR